MSILPAGASPDAPILLVTRSVRGLVDGLASVVLPAYLALLGFTAAQVGAVVTGTLIGSAALTLAVGYWGHRLERRRLLQAVALVMVGTGIGFAALSSFWLIVAVAVVGTLNPSGGDVSVFLPTEQALLPSTAPARERTSLFARYALLASLAAAVGSLAAGVPEMARRRGWLSEIASLRGVFVAYAVAGASLVVLYRRLSPGLGAEHGRQRASLGRSRSVVYRLAALFSLDSFAGGFTVQAILALWLFRRYDLSLGTTGVIFSVTSLLSAASGLLAPALARRIGLVRTMVYTHLPANGLLVAAALMPNVQLAVACLIARSLLSQMDVPARTSYVMAIVDPEERPAAASITNVPRSLAAALPPAAAGWMLGRTTFGWPLVVAGVLKATYDLLLLARFRHLTPPEETALAAP